MQAIPLIINFKKASALHANNMPDTAIIKIFVDELSDRAVAIDDCISKLTTGAVIEDVNATITTAVHATKGDAYLLNLNYMGDLFSTAESYFVKLNDKSDVDEAISTAGRISDVLKKIISEIKQSKFESSENTSELITTLNSVCRELLEDNR